MYIIYYCCIFTSLLFWKSICYRNRIGNLCSCYFCIRPTSFVVVDVGLLFFMELSSIIYRLLFLQTLIACFIVDLVRNSYMQYHIHCYVQYFRLILLKCWVVAFSMFFCLELSLTLFLISCTLYPSLLSLSFTTNYYIYGIICVMTFIYYRAITILYNAFKKVNLQKATTVPIPNNNTVLIFSFCP